MTESINRNTEVLLDKISRDTLLILRVHINHYDFLPALSKAFEENGKIESDDVMRYFDEEIISENEDVRSRTVASNLYKEERGNVKQLVSNFFPDNGHLNKASQLLDAINKKLG